MYTSEWIHVVDLSNSGDVQRDQSSSLASVLMTIESARDGAEFTAKVQAELAVCHAAVVLLVRLG